MRPYILGAFERALKIWRRLSVPKGDLVVADTYRNGREHGLVVMARCIAEGYVAWSENRRSDDIVVYVGKDAWDGLTDDGYNNRKLFRSEETALKYVQKQVNRMVREAKRVEKALMAA